MENEKRLRLARNKKINEETIRVNNEILKVPSHLNDDERKIYQEIITQLKESIRYRLSKTDSELIWQYCQLKIIRDRAWKEYNKKPDRYVRVVTGICSDGKTPKVLVKENEHYRTLIDTNKQLERILKDLKLTPELRRKF